ncbi:hypothetical protein F4859DRAFT_74586 [Xylaria cf. heliscus]|nr:hypothetical protein F4859DRAFT_74586 [Xylaria cf. heliscus]
MASMEVQVGPTTNNAVDSPAVAANAYYHNPYDLHHHHHHHQLPPQPLQLQPPFQQQNGYYGYAPPASKMRKRKAESQENERLSKRLSKRLNSLHLQKNAHRQYVPVENTGSQPLPSHPANSNPVQSSPPSTTVTVDDSMQLDNTKHKVYIYDLDAELSSADESSENGSRPGSPTSGHDRVIFMPDMKKHLCRPKIPPVVLANSEGKLAGHDINDMQMVLYSEPSSLTVPREQDSVRKAILEARARARQRQKDAQAETQQETQASSSTTSIHGLGNTHGVNVAIDSFGGATNGFSGNATSWREGPIVDDDNDDVDAMDMD